MCCRDGVICNGCEYPCCCFNERKADDGDEIEKEEEDEEEDDDEDEDEEVKEEAVGGEVRSE